MNYQELLQTKYTDQELRDELKRRHEIKVEERRQQNARRVCCINCKHRFRGYNGKVAYFKSTVCKAKPKVGQYNMVTGKPIQLYVACSYKYSNNCKLFEHKDKQYRNEDSNSNK